MDADRCAFDAGAGGERAQVEAEQGPVPDVLSSRVIHRVEPRFAAAGAHAAAVVAGVLAIFDRAVEARRAREDARVDLDGPSALRICKPSRVGDHAERPSPLPGGLELVLDGVGARGQLAIGVGDARRREDDLGFAVWVAEDDRAVGFKRWRQSVRSIELEVIPIGCFGRGKLDRLLEAVGDVCDLYFCVFVKPIAREVVFGLRRFRLFPQ